MQLMKYETACRAVADAKSIDEVKEITNIAEAARAYARQAKNKVMELDAIEIRVRAERRLGEILLDARKQGLIGQGRGMRPMKLEEIGVDKKIAPTAQRLAKLPSDRFEAEMVDWRSKAEKTHRFEIPLQHIRLPSLRADRERIAARSGRNAVNESNPLDRFKSPDGRLIVNWRVGELDRIEQLAERTVRCVKALRDAMPTANPDPFDTIEMIFSDRSTLLSILELEWDKPIPNADAGLQGAIESSRNKKLVDEYGRTCQWCGKFFVIGRLGGAGRRNPDRVGLFCSIHCQSKGRKKRGVNHS